MKDNLNKRGITGISERPHNGQRQRFPFIACLIILAGLAAPVLGAEFVTTGSLRTARSGHVAVLLANGQVLVTGGTDDGGSALASAELYNPTNGTWAATGSMRTNRQYFAATLLANGKVLVAGGFDTDFNDLASAELYDPVSGTWALTTAMPATRASHTATRLSNGKVLIAGGENVNGALATAVLYNPTNGTWATTGMMATGRVFPTATLLANGKVLVTGGIDANSAPLTSAELYNPATGAWTTAGTMSSARSFHTATRLSNGMVLVAGGDGANGTVATAALYNPTNGTWVATGTMIDARSYHTATLLANGKVLAAGGGITDLASAELYDPTAGTWTVTTFMNGGRYDHTATRLANGNVLMAGGLDADVAPMASAEVYYDQVGFEIMTPRVLPVGYLGANYNQTLTVGGGVAPYVWTVVSNSLPPGLSLVSNSGVITGIPTVRTNAAFRVRVMEAGAKTAEKDFNLVIFDRSCTNTITTSVVGRGSASGGGTVLCEASVTVRATGDACSTFVNWTENGVAVSADPDYTFVASRDRTLVANFEPVPFMIDASVAPAGSGNISGGGTVECGTDVTVTATPINGCHQFVNWTENGVAVSANASYTFTANTNRILVANFIPVSATITMIASPPGGGATSGDGIKVCGSIVTVTASPARCYHLVNWTENGTVVSTDTNYTFTVGGSRDLVANFSRFVEITTSVEPPGSGLITGGGPASCGTSLTLTASPAPSWLFKNWTEAGTNLGNSVSYTFTVSHERSLVGNFMLCTYGLSVTNVSVTAATITNAVSVTTTSICPWTATADAAWLVIRSGTSGTGNGVVTYRIMPNGDPAPRTNTLTIGWRPIPVIQAGNLAPIVSVGSVTPLTLPVTSVTLAATVTDDQALNTNPLLSWSKVSGPGAVSFASPHARSTSANFSTNGAYVVQLVADDGVLRTTGTVTVVVNARPVVTSAPAVSNPFAVAGGTPICRLGMTNEFTVSAMDPDDNQFSYLWDFGDGGTSTNASPAHVFTTAGTHAVTVTLNDGLATTSTGLVVSVLRSFLDLPKPMKLTMKSDFAVGKMDAASLSATFQQPPPPFSLTNVVATVNIGGVTLDFPINAKGSGTNGVNKLKVAANKKTGVVKLTVKLKGYYDATWATQGLTNADVLVAQQIKVPVLLLFKGTPVESFAADKTLFYKAKAGKSGSAK